MMSDSVQLRVVFEQGVSASLLVDKRISLSRPHWVEELPSIRHFVDRYGLRPLCRLYQPDFGPWGHDFFDLREGMVPQGEFHKLLLGGELKGAPLDAFRRIYTWTDAAHYHLGHIVDSYVGTIEEAITDSPGIGRKYSRSEIPDTFPCHRWVKRLPFDGVYVMSGNNHSEDVYYNFVAFLLAVKRSLNSLRLALNCCDWAKGCTFGKEFNKVLKRIRSGTDHMPPELRDLFTHAETGWALEAIEYRDRVEHYAATSDTMPLGLYGFTVSLRDAIVGIHNLLPDSPVSCAKDFTYETGRDYLTYSVEIYSQLVPFVLDVCRATLLAEQHN
jgi:hypothetical protein